MSDEKFVDITGSSPRVRGTVGVGGVFVCVIRFIPACAGNSLCLMKSSSTSPVHPRVCGEQILIERDPELTYGSSPRVRGTDELT